MAVELLNTVVPLEVVEANTIVRCEVGSTAHGIGVAGTDDRDEMGVCIEPPENVIGLRRFEQLVQRSKPEGVRSEAGDLDVVVYGLRKFASLALKGNPSVLLLLNVPDEKCSVLTELGRELRDLSWAFASKRAGTAFLGYMRQQRERLAGERGQMNVNRPELVEQFGYDVKYAAHILRLGYQGIAYLNTGSFPIPMPDDQREYIVAVRTGGVSEKEVLARIEALEAELLVAVAASPLVDEPDYDVVNSFLVDAYQRGWQRQGLN